MIDCLKDSSGELRHTDDGILDVAKSFYKELYTNKPCSDENLESYFSSLPREHILDNEPQSKCEGLVSYAECLHALNKMKKNKSPGMDGITTEFYQAFWPLLGNLLVGVFNESYELGKLPDSQRKSVMSLIFKRGMRMTSVIIDQLALLILIIEFWPLL